MDKYTNTVFKSLAPVALLSLPLFASVAYSQQAKEKPYGASLSFSYEGRYDDNATRQQEGSTKIGERQDRVRADFGAYYTGASVSFDSSYSVFEERFDKNSQELNQRFTGLTNLDVFSSDSRFRIDIDHERATLFSSPNDVGIAENTEERDTLSIAPSVRGKPTAPIVPVLTAYYSETRYLESDSNNFALGGLQLELNRSLNSYRSLGFRAFATKTEFDVASEFDYEYYSLSLVFQSELRALSYLLELGTDFQEAADGAQEQSEFYNLEISYALSNSNIEFSSSRSLSDSSSANSSIGEFDNTGVGSNLDQLDLVSLTFHRLAWTAQPCRLCQFSLEASSNIIDYRNLTINNLETNIVSATFEYRLNNDYDLSLRLADRYVDNENQPEANLHSNIVSAGVTKTFNEFFTAGFEYRWQNEDRDGLDSDNNIYTLSATWNAF